MLSLNRKGRKAALVILLVLLSGIIITGSWLFLTFNNQKSSRSLSSIHNAGNIHNPAANETKNGITVTSEVLMQLLPVTGNDLTAPPSVKTISFVTPPLPATQVEEITKFIDPANGGYIESLKGSVVQIPANAFVDSKGNPIKENVKVTFSEYHDFKDIFLSGIPMVYKLNGKDEQFESAGMMKLEASAAGKGTVYTSAENRIKVMLASNTKSKDYNLYYFDDKKGNWVEKGKDEVIYKKKKVQRTSILRRMTSYVPKKREVYLTAFEGVPEDKVFLWWRSPAKDFDFSFTRISKSFPELKPLSGIRWEYRGADAKEVYAALFNVHPRDKNVVAQRGQWKTCTIAMKEQDETYALTLEGEDHSLTIDIRPADRSEKNILKVRKRFEKYEADLAKRIKDDVADYVKYQEDSIVYSYDEAAVASAENDIVRSFSVDNFGIWNCDRIATIENAVAYKLEFVDENGKSLNVKRVYIADKRYNSVLNFDRTDNYHNVSLNPYSNNLIWAVLPGNKLAVVSQDKIWGLQGKSGRQKLTMKVSDDAVASIEDVRESLNF